MSAQSTQLNLFPSSQTVELGVIAARLERPDPAQEVQVDEAERYLSSYALDLGSSMLLFGVDEAGRGPWAGPVVAAAVALPVGFGVDAPLPQDLALLNDSKRLTERRRLELIRPICRRALAVGVGISSPELIDEVNIAVANQRAMRSAVAHASRALRRASMSDAETERLMTRSLALIDGKFTVPELDLPQVAMIQGDRRSYHIAAASVIAKVTRDKIMSAAHRRYPHYGFDRHKGYGTKAHQAALTEFGPCPIHRRSYAPVRRALGLE